MKIYQAKGTASSVYEVDSWKRLKRLVTGDIFIVLKIIKSNKHGLSKYHIYPLSRKRKVELTLLSNSLEEANHWFERIK